MLAHLLVSDVTQNKLFGDFEYKRAHMLKWGKIRVNDGQRLRFRKRRTDFKYYHVGGMSNLKICETYCFFFLM